jgi:hypothetical protein
MTHTDPTPSRSEPTGDDVARMVSDTIVGPNTRWSDNVYQAIAIVVCLVLGAAIGAFSLTDRAAGALVGGFIGLLVGLFGSGIFLMIYRAVRHIRGRHD